MTHQLKALSTSKLGIISLILIIFAWIIIGFSIYQYGFKKPTIYIYRTMDVIGNGDPSNSSDPNWNEWDHWLFDAGGLVDQMEDELGLKIEWLPPMSLVDIMTKLKAWDVKGPWSAGPGDIHLVFLKPGHAAEFKTQGVQLVNLSAHLSEIPNAAKIPYQDRQFAFDVPIAGSMLQFWRSQYTFIYQSNGSDNYFPNGVKVPNTITELAELCMNGSLTFNDTDANGMAEGHLGIGSPGRGAIQHYFENINDEVSLEFPGDGSSSGRRMIWAWLKAYNCSFNFSNEPDLETYSDYLSLIEDESWKAGWDSLRWALHNGSIGIGLNSSNNNPILLAKSDGEPSGSSVMKSMRDQYVNGTSTWATFYAIDVLNRNLVAADRYGLPDSIRAKMMSGIPAGGGCYLAVPKAITEVNKEYAFKVVNYLLSDKIQLRLFSEMFQYPGIDILENGNSVWEYLAINYPTIYGKTVPSWETISQLRVELGPANAINYIEAIWPYKLGLMETWDEPLWSENFKT